MINGAESEIRTHDCQAIKPGLLPLNYFDKSRALPTELLAHSDLFSRKCSTLTKKLFDYLGILLASAGLEKCDADVNCVDFLFVSHSKYFPFVFIDGACQWSRTTTLRFFRPVLQTASKLDRHIWCG